MNVLVATLDFDQVFFLMSRSESIGTGELDQSYLEKSAYLYFLRHTSSEDLMKMHSVDTTEEATRIAVDLEAEVLYPDFEQTAGGMVQ